MHIQCSSSVFTTALDMKLIILVGLIACSYADKLDRTYLPPASAGTAGGSPGSLTAPGAFNPQSSLEGLGQQTFGQNPQTGSNFGQAPSQSSFGQGPKVGSNIGQTPSQSNFGPNQGSIGTLQSNFGSNLNQGSIDTAFGQPSNIDNSNIAQPERERASVDRNAEILRYDNENDGNNFAYSFETSNGIAADESGTAANGVQAQGGFSYTGDDGQQYSIRYTADENGYLPQGDHLPTPHPIPEEILKSIEKNAEAAAAGTQEGAYNPDEDSNDISGNVYNDAAPSSQSGQVAPGVSAGVNGPSSFGPGSQSSNAQGYPRGPASAGPQRPQGSQTGPGSSPFGSPNQGYPTGPAQAQPTPYGSQGSATQQGQPQFTAPGSAPGSDQGYPRGPAQSPSSGSQTPQNVQRPTSLFGTPSGSDQVSGPQGYPRGPAKPSQSSPSGFPSQSGQGIFGTPSTTGPSGPQGYPSGPSQSNPSSPFGSQGQRGPSRFGAPSAPSSEGYPRGPASSQPASQGFPSQRGPTPSTDYTPSASSPSRLNQQQGSNQNAPSTQGGDAGYQYNRPTGPSGQSQPNNQASFPSTQYGTPTQDAARPTSQGFLNNQRPSQFGSMLPISSRPQNTPQSSQAPTASQGYPQNNPRPTSQYGVPASDKPQFNAPSSSPIPSGAPAFSQTNPQFGASSTVSTIRPTSSQNFGQSGPAVQAQDESGYQYNRPQTQFGDSRPSAAGPLSGPSAPQGTRPSFASNIPTGPARGPQGSSRPTGPAETGYPSGPSSTSFPSGPSSTSFPSGPSSTGYPSGPASTGSRPESFRPSSPTGTSGFSRPNTAAENIQGNFGSPSGPMPQSAPYKYDAPQNTAGPTGPQSTFGSARPNQVGSFGQPGQNRPGVTGPSGQERPGQEFGGPRQPPSFSSEEGYKY